MIHVPLLLAAAVAGLAPAATPPVAPMLREDPPPPGEPAPGWVGIEATQVEGIVAIDDAVERALRRSGEVQAAEREVEVARERARAAGALPDPEVEVEAAGHRASDLEHLEVGVGIDLTHAALAPMRRRAEEEGVRAAEARARAARLRLAHEVRTAYRAVQAGREALGAANRSLDALAASGELARALADAGNVPELFASTHEAAYEEARLDAARLEASLIDARARLAALLGDDVQVVPGIAPAGEVATPADAPREALAASLELAELERLEERALRRGRVLGIAGHLPDVDVRVFGEREDGHWAKGVGVELTLPVFGARRSEARAERAEAASFAARRRTLEDRLDAQARRLVKTVQSARARAGHLEHRVIPARERVLHQTLLQYNAMQLDAFELLRAHRELLRARLQSVEATREHADAADALRALLAGVQVDVAGHAAPLPQVEAGAAGGGH